MPAPIEPVPHTKRPIPPADQITMTEGPHFSFRDRWESTFYNGEYGIAREVVVKRCKYSGAPTDDPVKETWHLEEPGHKNGARRFRTVEELREYANGGKNE